MDYDNYVKHISQKYKLAIALAVLKEKPENLSIEQYIAELRNKINIHSKSDDLDITLGSDDFNFNDDDELNDFIDKAIDLNGFDNNISNDSITILDNFDVNMAMAGELQKEIALKEIEKLTETIETNSFQAPNTSNHSQDFNSYESDYLRDSTNNGAKTKALHILKNIRKEYVNKAQESYLDNSIFSVKDRINENNTYTNFKERPNNNKLTNIQNQNEMDVDTKVDITDDFESQKNDTTNYFTNVNYCTNVNETETLQININKSLAAKVYNNISKDYTRTDLKTIEKTGYEKMYTTNEDAEKDSPKCLENKQKDEIDITEKVRQYLAKQTQDILEKAKIDKHNFSETQNLNSQGELLSNDSNKTNNNINIKENSKQTNVNNHCTNEIDTQTTILYTYNEASQNCTHISQSQSNYIELPDNFIFGRKDVANYEMSKKTNSMYNWDGSGTTVDNTKSNFDANKHYYEENYNVILTNNILKDKRSNAEFNSNNNAEIIQIDYKTGNSNNNIATENLSLEDANKLDTNTRNTSQELNTVTRNDTELTNETQIAYVIDKNGNAYKILNGDFQNNSTITMAKETDIGKVFNNINRQIIEGTNVEENNKNEENIDTLSTDDEATTQKEIVPFKVIEELNKVKMFLNRKVERNSEGYLADSGYNSDSQSRSSFKSALQNSNGWVNQSAFCLFNYIIECPLNEATSDLSLQISQVLGKLIDKLHDIENYPSFLEEILEYIEKCIQNIYTKDNSILANDEYIQRILLLNKSIHIIKYSVEKINTQLEDLHEKLTNHSTYELENISKLENVCHLFHLLEILIKRHLRGRNNSNDMATQSQEEKLFKKSSITDIWKKKWNPDYKKVEKSQGLFEKKCVMSKCSNLLNKIVVHCMEGYSLVAYAALQCFNLLQS